MNRTIFLLGFLCILPYHIQGATTEHEAINKAIDDAELNTPLVDICAAPSSIVGGAVNVITGNYVESCCDLTILGANPLQVQRYFNSGGTEEGSLCNGWNLNLPSKVTISTMGDMIYAALEDRGATYNFKAEGTKDIFKIRERQLKYGITNCSSGSLSSRNNIKNKYLYYTFRARHCELHDDSDEIIVYKHRKTENESLNYLISDNFLPNGCCLSYDYDGQRRIKEVKSKGLSRKTLSYINWFYNKTENSKPDLTLISSDNRKIEYKFK